MKPVSSVASGVFCITLLWLGFVIAISYVETPIRFAAEDISVVEALSIGRILFHTLNGIEIAFATISLFITFYLAKTQFANRTKILLVCAVAILAVQTSLLFTILDARTNARLRGEEVGPSSAHQIYIGIDLLKIAFLCALSYFQVCDFSSLIRKSANAEPRS